MKKYELLQFLEPFDDDIEIVVSAGKGNGSFIPIAKAMYEIRKGEGFAVLLPTVQVNEGQK